MNLLDLVLLVLATWRLTALAMLEDGPWDVLRICRELVCRIRFMARLLDCFWCTSVWAAGFLVLVLLAGRVDERVCILAWLAASGGAIVINEVLPTWGGQGGEHGQG